MERRPIFYGTRLNQSKRNDSVDQIGPINKRKARLNSQQTVRDSQGRQRFHGAFTGGFSAGYFNTVDTVQGFKPREFVARRNDEGRRKEGSNSGFSHRPEDYMDDEDLGEFGIAPKRLRINSQLYSNEGADATRGLDPIGKILRPSYQSIGEKILQAMDPTVDMRFDSIVASEVIHSLKDNFHGLGYKPLRKMDSSGKSRVTNNPLVGVGESGRRIKISGEAFGTGILDDEDDFDVFDHGYDNINDYDRGRRQNTSASHLSNYRKDGTAGRASSDDYLIAGFSLAKETFRIELGLGIYLQSYKLPQIPDSWIEPIRKEPFIPPGEQEIETNLEFSRGSSLFTKKFTPASTHPKSSIQIESKSGLLHYSDLKKTQDAQDQILPLANDPGADLAPSIVRQVLEWRPCGLLCKRFNVQNPFPDDKLVGVKELDLAIHPGKTIDESHNMAEPDDQTRRPRPSSLDLKRSIFNVIFEQPSNSEPDPSNNRIPLIESEEDPQIVGVEELQRLSADCDTKEDDYETLSHSSGTNEDIEVLTAAKPEPELIVLTDSSDSSPRNSPRAKRSLVRSDSLPDPDSYGPPLPPTLKRLLDSEQLHRNDHRRKKSKKKKRHKK